MNKTTVVDYRYHKYDVFIGRPSIYGNPYRIGIDGTREQVVEKFRVYFHKRIKEDPYFKSAVMGLKGKILGCFCKGSKTTTLKPVPCHGDVYVEYLEGERG